MINFLLLWILIQTMVFLVLAAIMIGSCRPQLLRRLIGIRRPFAGQGFGAQPGFGAQQGFGAQPGFVAPGKNILVHLHSLDKNSSH